MFTPKLHIEKTSGKLVISDATGEYSEDNTGGWGAPNPSHEEVAKAVLRVRRNGKIIETRSITSLYSEPLPPVYMGYLTTEQGVEITESVVTGATYSGQHNIISPDSNHANFPNKINIPWQDVFSEMNEHFLYSFWVAVPEMLVGEYLYRQNTDFPQVHGSLSDIATATEMSINGVNYRIYLVDHNFPGNLRFSITPF